MQKETWSGTTEYVVNWTTSDLPVPEDAGIEKAWLYVYYCWDSKHVMPDNVSMTFNTAAVSLAPSYSDWKGFGTYYGFGMLKYNVTDNFVAGPNTAVLTNSYPGGGNVSMKSMLLMVVYKHPDERERIICIDEGYDIIYAHKGYGISSEEATTYATFTCCEPIPLDEIGEATLITVAPDANEGDDANRLYFNDHVWKGAWSPVNCIVYEDKAPFCIAETDVRKYLKATDNTAAFQSHIPDGGTIGDFMEASNAFLILEKQNLLWYEINDELDTLKENVSEAIMPSIIQRRLIDKLEYAKALKENAKIECEAGNFEGATKKLGVAKSQVKSFESMVKITRRIKQEDKASFLADSAEIKGKISELIEYIETEHEC